MKGERKINFLSPTPPLKTFFSEKCICVRNILDFYGILGYIRHFWVTTYYKVSKRNSETTTCFSNSGLFVQITHHELKARPDGGFNE